MVLITELQHKQRACVYKCARILIHVCINFFFRFQLFLNMVKG